MHAEDQIASENFSFFLVPRVSLTGDKQGRTSVVSPRETTLERARARFISYFIYLSRRERRRIKRDDDDDDDASSSSSRPRSRSLFLLVGEY